VSRVSLLRRAAVAMLVVGLFAGAAACGDDDASSDGGSTDQTADGPGAADATLEVDSIAYSDVTAPAGGTLEIDSTSGVAHTFTADDGSFDVSYDADGRRRHADRTGRLPVPLQHPRVDDRHSQGRLATTLPG
jgi:hypothetical protein